MPISEFFPLARIKIDELRQPQALQKTQHIMHRFQL